MAQRMYYIVGDSYVDSLLFDNSKSKNGNFVGTDIPMYQGSVDDILKSSTDSIAVLNGKCKLYYSAANVDTTIEGISFYLREFVPVRNSNSYFLMRCSNITFLYRSTIPTISFSFMKTQNIDSHMQFYVIRASYVLLNRRQADSAIYLYDSNEYWEGLGICLPSFRVYVISLLVDSIAAINDHNYKEYIGFCLSRYKSRLRNCVEYCGCKNPEDYECLLECVDNLEYSCDWETYMYYFWHSMMVCDSTVFKNVYKLIRSNNNNHAVEEIEVLLNDFRDLFQGLGLCVK